MRPRIKAIHKTSAIACLAFGLGACAYLPDIKNLRKQQPPLDAEALTVVDGETLLDQTQANEALRPVLNQASSAEQLRELLKFEEQVSGNPLVVDNDIQLLIDGEQTYAAIFDAIKQAKQHIHIISYIFADDDLGQDLAELLKDKVAEGVEVRLIVDAIGGLFVSEAFYADLEDAGIKVSKFNPIDPLEDPQLWRINHREHSKLIIVDGRTVFTGGMNISAVYSSKLSRLRSVPQPQDIIRSRAWRDTHVRVVGPVSIYFQKRFIETWNSVSAESIDDLLNYIPSHANRQRKTAIIRLLDDQGADSKYEIYALYLNAIEHAQSRLWLTHAYFAPNKTLINALKQAAQRGVDVRIILPGLLDHGLVYHSSRSRYGELIEAGIKICNFEDRMLHAKTMVMDGLWSTIGSANLDFRSFIHNNELNISVLDTRFAQVLEAQFLKDLKTCKPVTLEQWQQRPLSDKLKEGFSRLLDYWL